MKKFIFKSLLYVFVILAVFAIVASVTNNGLRKSEFGNLKEWRDILAGKIDADILVQGSSRAWVQYNPAIIDTILSTNSYNMGMDGAAFDIQYIRFKAYLLNNKAPKYIIQNVDTDLLDPEEDFYQMYQLLPFLENKPFKKLLIEHDILSFSDIYLPFMSYMGQAKSLQIGFSEFFGLKHYQSEKYKGFAAWDAAWDESKLEQRKKLGKVNWRTNKETYQLFQQFITECNQNNIKLVLVYAPIYHEVTDLVIDFESSRTLFSSIAKENNIAFLDYSLCDISFDKNNFYNTTHLNATGSELFTIKLCKDLMEKGVMPNKKH